MNYFLTEQMGMSHELIIISGLIGVAILYPVIRLMEKQEHARKEAAVTAQKETVPSEVNA